MQTKQKIFDCALTLFSEKGFNGVSVREIAKGVGIKESSIYNHYKGKKAIIEDICEQFISTLSVSRPPLAGIEKMLDHMKPREIFQSLIASYGSQINQRISQMARVVFGEQFHDEMARRIFMEEIVLKNAEYYEKVLTLMESKNRIILCDKRLVANLFNNQQVQLSIQYALCQTEEELKQVIGMMWNSADYLIGKLEIDLQKP